ncbi:hypothetical protein QBC39DRAFT_344729 [Podospora conica]|nr:hypothetical protein QBC39DRAFT_344729 [Schizothecium conicum]
MGPDSRIDRFHDLLRRPADYPATLLRKLYPHEVHRHSALRQNLNKNQAAFFDGNKPSIGIWETHQRKFYSSNHHSAESLRKHLNRGSKDPRIRHGFLQSSDSRSPLNCTLEMFTTLCTYQQVDASFLNDVQAFGEQDEPKDLCLASVGATHSLHLPGRSLVELPELGRSGRELHIRYLLRSVEAKEDRKWPWQIRQTAVYHSFDVETGRTFWLTLKGNDEFRDRIQKASGSLDFSSTTDDDPAFYFRASLSTHLVYLAWCDENWRQCINDLEACTHEIRDNARTTPIDEGLKESPNKLMHYPKSLRPTRGNSTYSKSKPNTRPPSNRISKINTGLSGPQAGNGLRKQSTLEVIRGAHQSLAGLAGRRLSPIWRRSTVKDVEKGSLSQTAPPASSDSSVVALVDPRFVLDKFRFSDIQTLHTFSDRIRRYMLTIELDMSVLDQLHAFYDDLLRGDADNFKTIRLACKHDLISFLAEVKFISRSLAARKKQLECLAAILAQGITLYDGILQQRQLDIAQRFQETAQQSATQMQVIANKTKLETASMHVITVVTLIFLPATFVATFFQSGAIKLGEVGESYVINQAGMRLFGSVAGVVTVLTVGAWIVVYITMRLRLKRELQPVLPK